MKLESAYQEPDNEAQQVTEEQIFGVLKEHEAGMATAQCLPQAQRQPRDLLQLEGQFGWLEVSEAKRLKGLEGEKMLA